jgi:hemerythrin superfamily protein
MDAIEMLEEQHRNVEDIFRQIEEAPRAGKGALFEELADELTIHAAIEERHFYPAARHASTEEIVHEALEDHLAVKLLLAVLLQMDAEESDFDEKIAMLKTQVSEHVREEERELFPRVREVLDEKILVALAEEMSDTLEILVERGQPRRMLRAQASSDAPSLR